jgi:hypothetical protein
MNSNAQSIATVGQVLSFIETNEATFAVLETAATNRGKWGGYINLRLVRVAKGSTYRSPRSKGVKVLDHIGSVYGQCRGPRSRYAQVVAAMTKELAAQI